MFKKLFWILIFFTIVLSGCDSEKHDLYNAIMQKDKLVVGISFNSKPFGFVDAKGKVQGLEADLAREIADRILGDESKVVFVNITPQERIQAAKNGNVDMVISTMTITPQRKKIIDFSVPYFIAGQVICVKKDSKIESHYDLNNKKVIVILDTTGEKNVKEIAPNALVQSYSDNLDAIQAFKNGSGDAITTDDSLLQGFVMDNVDYIILPEKLTKEPYGIAFQKNKQANKFKKTINNILNEIMYDGTLDNIKEKWGIT